MCRRRGGIDGFELFGNRVQAREGAAIVVLIVALDEFWRDAQKRPGPTEQGCDLIWHVDVSRIRRGRLDDVMPNAAALRRGDVASARLRPDSGNDMRQAHSPRAGDVQCLGGCLWKLGDCNWAQQLPNDLPQPE